MSTDTDDWADLRDAWSATPMSAETLDHLKTRIRRERIRTWIEGAIEAAVAIACAAAFLWWGRTAQGGEKTLLLALAAASIASLLVSTALRRAVWRAQGETVAACRATLLRQARLGLAFARLGYVGGPAGVAAGLVLAEFGGIDAARGDPLNAVIGVAASLTLTLGWLWSIREAGRRRRMIEDLSTDVGAT